MLPFLKQDSYNEMPPTLDAMPLSRWLSNLFRCLEELQ
jgi:hypothetical protein